MAIAEDAHLEKVFEDLRLRLLDLTKRNRMLNYPVQRSSKRQLQFVDEVIESVHAKLVDDDLSLRIAPLSEPDVTPPEEKTEDFLSTLAHAKVADIEYLVAIEAIEASGGTDEATLEKAEAELRARVRTQLGLPPRRRLADVNRNDHARSLGIEPNVDPPS